jgi:hypothetical protein
MYKLPLAAAMNNAITLTWNTRSVFRNGLLTAALIPKMVVVGWGCAYTCPPHKKPPEKSTLSKSKDQMRGGAVSHRIPRWWRLGGERRLTARLGGGNPTRIQLEANKTIVETSIW